MLFHFLLLIHKTEMKLHFCFTLHLCAQSKPTLHYLKKYGNPKALRNISASDIRLFGLNILETLKLLHEKGYPYGKDGKTFVLSMFCLRNVFCQKLYSCCLHFC